VQIVITSDDVSDKHCGAAGKQALVQMPSKTASGRRRLVLRDELHLTGSKEGCNSGDCGACSVTVDCRLVCSCLMLAVEAEGHKIETIEGMARGHDLHPRAAELRAQ
jgi:aerobic-type carbon monoxide dehydrogenase small subunit (CoxS/CutS family)